VFPLQERVVLGFVGIAVETFVESVERMKKLEEEIVKYSGNNNINKDEARYFVGKETQKNYFHSFLFER
jgi:hypothetical protein